MICKQKNKETYTELFTTMSKATPELKTKLRAFGQDRDNAIFAAHTNEFPTSISFHDTIHMRRNMEQFIKQDCHLSDRFSKSVMIDLFGDRLREGLYHADTKNEFDAHVERLKVMSYLLFDSEIDAKILEIF